METNAFLVMIPLIFILLFTEPVYRTFMDPGPLPNPDRTDSLLKWMHSQGTAVALRKDTAFYLFDPNTISAESLVSLGLPEKTANRIINYRNKGGSFSKPEEVLRIFGMDSAWYKRALPWMRFSDQHPKRKNPRISNKLIMLDDINMADSARLEDVYGIGPALARRIIKFRDRLGGFVRISQLTEVYGLDTTVVQSIARQFEVRPGFQPRIIRLNNASTEELGQHPYIRWQAASAIVAYRVQHGPFDSLEQLRQLPFVKDDWIDKIRPYVRLGDFTPK